MTTTPPNPDLSVVIVSWNTRDLLLQCLESLKADAPRSRLYLETIVVDNASHDASVDAVRSAYPEVSVLAQSENLGFAAATNLGIEHTRGKSILVLNPDTEVQPGALRTLWNALSAAPHIGMVAPLLVNPDGSFQSAGYRFPGLTQTLLDLFPLHPRLIESSLNGRYNGGDGLTPFGIDHPLGACMLVRRTVIDSVGALDTSYFMYSEEIDWCQRIKAAGWTILTAPAARVIHHGGKSTEQAPDRMRPALHRSRARYLRRYQTPAFHRTLHRVMGAGVSLKRVGVPIPTGGRSVSELGEIIGVYRDAERADV